MALAQAIPQNMYTKDEVDKMIDAALKRVDATLRELGRHQARWELSFQKLEDRHTQEMLRIENKFEKALNDTMNRAVSRLTLNISIILGIVTLATSAVHYLH